MTDAAQPFHNLTRPTKNMTDATQLSHDIDTPDKKSAHEPSPSIRDHDGPRTKSPNKTTTASPKHRPHHLLLLVHNRGPLSARHYDTHNRLAPTTPPNTDFAATRSGENRTHEPQTGGASMPDIVNELGTTRQTVPQYQDT